MFTLVEKKAPLPRLPTPTSTVAPVAMAMRPVQRIIDPKRNSQIPIEIEKVTTIIPPLEKKSKMAPIFCPADEVKIEYFEN